MQLDARSVPAGDTFETAYCIIGAGAAGTTLALQLTKAGKDVTLLESGDSVADPQIQDLTDGDISGRPYPLSSSRLRLMGGTTNHWTGHCYRFLERDFIAKEWLNSPDWPIRLADVQPFYDEAAKLVLFSDDSKDWSLDTWRRRLNTEKLPLDGSLFSSRLEYQSPILPSTGRRSFAFYHPELIKSPHLKLYKYATVTEIVTDAVGQSVTEVHVRSPGGNTFRIRPKLTILAAGGIENARLLLASRRTSPNGIGNEHDQVGRYFTDHVFFRERLVRNPDVAFDRLLAWNDIDAMNRVVAHLVPSDEVLRRERIHDVFIRVLPQYPEPSAEVAAAKRIAEGLSTLNASSISGDDLSTAISGFGTLAAKAWDKLTGEDQPLEQGVIVRIEPQPVAASRVTLTNERDAFGMPRSHLHWDLPDSTKHSAARTIALLAQEVGKHGVGRVHANFKPEDDWPGDLEVGYHHCCTTRMSDDPKNGVVDRNCRVHGVGNLYVAGSSVFTTAGSGSPTMTLVALALRLSRHLTETRL
jgi:choline dehydrogenase-like flavoprotein